MTSSYVYETASGSRIFGALISETDSAGREVRYYYDSTNGYLMASINVTDGNGTAYTYDDFANLVTVMPATYISEYAYSTVTSNENVSYTYDEHNRLSTVVTDSTTYTFAYDVFGNSSYIGVGTNTLASYEYNDYNGNLQKLNYANGVSVEYVYDDLDNVSEIWYTENEGTPTLAYSYTYTAKGQLYSLEDHVNSHTTIYEYDRNGRVVAMSEYDSEELVNILGSTVAYNSENLVSEAQYALANTFSAQGDNVSWNYSYRYTEDNKLQQMIFSSPSTICTVNYVYDALYRPWYKTYYYNTDADSAIEVSMTQEYRYKNYGDNTGVEVEFFSTKVNSNTALTFTYAYDNIGNITKIVSSDGNEYRYVYDDLGQLIREDNTKTRETYVYTYDNAGNIISKETYYLTDADETPIDSISVFNYAYADTSWSDKLTSYRGRNFTYDEIGNPLTYYNGTSYNFTWVQGRRLETVTSGGNTFTYTYNADGIRTSKTVGGVTKNYVLNGTQILGETWSDGTTIVYIYDAEGSAIGMLYRDDTYLDGEYDTFLYEYNLMGDVIAVYSSDGTKLVSYYYDAWGNMRTVYSNSGASSGAYYNPFTYCGYYRDSETGFYYLNSRYYDPVIGRFINPDAFVSTGQGLTGYNMFAYCGNNPVMLVDESGQGWILKLMTPLYHAVKSSIKTSNYISNKIAARSSAAYDTKNTLIENQNSKSFKKYYRYGFFNAGFNGCEVIAVHNVKVTLGIDSTFGDTAKQFQSVGGMWLFGVFGSYPHSIGSVLSLNGIDYSRVSSDELYKSGMYIISYWNTPGNITDGIHTIMIKYDGQNYTAYNYQNDSNTFPSLQDEWVTGFIYGYYIP